MLYTLPGTNDASFSSSGGQVLQTAIFSMGAGNSKIHQNTSKNVYYNLYVIHTNETTTSKNDDYEIF